jgi:hypothetical protein
MILRRSEEPDIPEEQEPNPEEEGAWEGAWEGVWEQ